MVDNADHRLAVFFFFTKLGKVTTLHIAIGVRVKTNYFISLHKFNKIQAKDLLKCHEEGKTEEGNVNFLLKVQSADKHISERYMRAKYMNTGGGDY